MAEVACKRHWRDDPRGYEDRLIWAEYVVHLFAGGEEVDWYRGETGYDGRAPHYAAMHKLIIFENADRLREKLHSMGFVTAWSVYDPSTPAVRAAWSKAYTSTSSIPARAQPWGMVEYIDRSWRAGLRQPPRGY